MRLFGSERISGIMTRLGMQENDPIEHSWLNRSIETAQRRVEQHNFSIRKRTLEYDDVMNKQREVVYNFRSGVLTNPDVHGYVLDVIHDLVLTQSEGYMTSERDSSPEDFSEWILSVFPVPVTAEELKTYAGKPDEAAQFVFQQVEEAYEIKCSMENPEMLANMERYVMLHCIDTEWQQYLRSMDELRDAVRLRAYGQRDPLVEYKREAFTLFEDLMARIKLTISTGVFRSSTSLQSMQNFMAQVRRPKRVQTQHAEVSLLATPSAQQATRVAPPQAGDAFDKALARAESATQRGASGDRQAPQPVVRDGEKIGRNDPCHCGSGKKFKKCCGKDY